MAISIEKDTAVVVIDGDTAGAVFAAAAEWIGANHRDMTLLGTDYDYEPGDDDAPDPRPHVLRLTVVSWSPR